MIETVELIKAWGTIPAIGIIGLLTWKLITFMGGMQKTMNNMQRTADKGVGNHLHTIQESTTVMREGIAELKGAADKTLFHLEQHTELLKKLVNK